MFIDMLILFLLLLTSCSSNYYDKKTILNPPLTSLGDIYYISDMESRKNLMQNYIFNSENSIIDKRRQFLGLNIDTPKIGLAMSGGGIRSNAFQLGILSGLYLSKIKEKLTSLDYIDYMSAVSGGSWAAASYKSFPRGDSEFYEKLRSIAKKEETKHPDNADVKYLFNSYADSVKNIRDSFKFEGMFKTVGYYGNDIWRYMLVNKCLENDIAISDIENNDIMNKRPYLIMNATHDAKILRPNYHNFPVEITSQHFGSLADCGNTESPYYCPFYETKYSSVFITGQTWKSKYISLSLAMAMSGAVAPPELHLINTDFKIDVPLYKGNSVRDTYVLTDGGQSENLGALSLMYRKAKLIIISDAAYDKHYNNDDLLELVWQAKHILGYDVIMKPPHDDEYITKGSYRDDYNKEAGCILYIKPVSKDILFEFESYLRDNYPYLLQNFVIHKKTIDFPMDETIKVSYDANLIRTYFVFGEYIASTRLSKELASFLNTPDGYCGFDIIPSKAVVNKPPPPEPLPSPECSGININIFSPEIRFERSEWCPQPQTKTLCDRLHEINNEDLFECTQVSQNTYFLRPKLTFLNKEWNKIHIKKNGHNVITTDISQYYNNLLQAMDKDMKYSLSFIGHASDAPYYCDENADLELLKYVDVTSGLYTINQEMSNYHKIKCEPNIGSSNNGNVYLSFLRAVKFADFFKRNLSNLMKPKISIIDITGRGDSRAHINNDEKDRYVIIVVDEYK